jgi:hypothetical protein
VVNDGDDIGEALARPGAGTKDVVLSGPREMDGFLLVQVQIQGQTDSAGIPLVPTKNAAALGMDRATINELLDRCASLKRRIDLDQRVAPEKTRRKGLFNFLLNLRVGNADETLDILGVVANHVVAELEYLHRKSSGSYKN